MHAMSLLDKWLQRNAFIGHRARGHALVRIVGALLNGVKLAPTYLGRHRAGRAFVKHHIKAVDRLLGNPPRVVIRRVSGVAFPLKTTGSASKSAPPSRLWCARRIAAILCSADSANNNCCLRHLELGA